MPMTFTPRILPADEVVEQLRALRSRQPVRYWAFYSSQLGGIVTDPALMVLPFDDHMVHRGHGVFDTAAIVSGKIYDLEAHLDRFVRSAGLSKLALPCAREEMRDLIVRTTAASGKRDGSIRYWISAGPGSLGLAPAAGAAPGFFVMIFAGLAYPETWNTQGIRVMTTTYPSSRRSTPSPRARTTCPTSSCRWRRRRRASTTASSWTRPATSARAPT